MQVAQIELEPIHRIAYLNAAKGGGSEMRFLDILRAHASGMKDCDAILATSDLQGMSPGGLGDVSSVWYTFSAGFRWVVGVAGGLIESSRTRLTICGHAHWDRPLAQTTRVHQFLNVDARAVLLVRDS